MEVQESAPTAKENRKSVGLQYLRDAGGVQRERRYRKVQEASVISSSSQNGPQEQRETQADNRLESSEPASDEDLLQDALDQRDALQHSRGKLARKGETTM